MLFIDGLIFVHSSLSSTFALAFASAKYLGAEE
jgi:hypothetical protein